MRAYRVTERKTNLNKETLPTIITISHNWHDISMFVETLGQAHAKIRKMRTWRLGEIKNIFGETMEAIPEEFPMNNVSRDGEDLLVDFQSAGVMGLAPTSVLLASYLYASALPKSVKKLP